MKVLQVIDRLDAGGAERVFLDQLRLLKGENLELGVLLIRAGGAWYAQIPPELPRFVLDRKSKFSLAKLWTLHRISASYDLLHVHMRHVYAYLRLAQILFRGRYKIVLQDHLGVDEQAPLPWRMKGWFRPEYYICVDSVQMEWAIKRMGLSSGQCFLLENQPLMEIPSLPTTQKEPSALMVANISRNKNLAFAVDLFIQRQEKLTIYGQVRDPHYYEQLQSKAGNKGLIRFVTDGSPVPFHRYDLGIFTSLRESGPLVLWEYLGHGLPFLAFPTGAVARKIQLHFPEFFIPDFESTRWMKRIDALRSRGDWENLTRGFYQDHYRPKDYVNKCLSIYQQVIY